MLITAKSNYMSEMVEEYKYDSQKLWQQIKSLG